MDYNSDRIIALGRAARKKGGGQRAAKEAIREEGLGGKGLPDGFHKMLALHLKRHLQWAV